MKELRWELHMRKVSVCMEDSRVRVWRLFAGFEMKAMQNPGTIMPCVINSGPLWSFARLDRHCKLSFSFLPGFILRVSVQSLILDCLLHYLGDVDAVSHCIRVSYLLASLN